MRFTILLLLLAAPALAEPPTPVVIPPDPALKWTEFKAEPCRQLRISVGIKADWALISKGCELAVDSDGKSATFTASKPGVYQFTATTPTGAAFIAVTVGNPDPNVPPVPPPVDTLTPKIKAAWDADKGTKDDAKLLAELYRQSVKLAGDATIPSSAELLRRVRVAGAALVTAEVLVSVRKAVADELGALFGMSSEEKMTDAQRKAAADLFTKLTTILEGL